MQVLPPPKPRPKRRSAQFIVLIIVAVFSGMLAARAIIIVSGVPKAPDKLFGDQHLKTAVALIELHKVRFGTYPGSLSDLKFTGEWDQIALQRVGYYPSADRTAYYVEVETGWIGKPDLKMPDEFWHGTGYTTSLKPTNQ
jgi:hypothetical protein